MSKVWVITSSVNDYNQYGEYFEKAYIGKPTLEDLKSFLRPMYTEYELDHVTEHLLKGGGRQGDEWKWFYLEEAE